jgi:ribosome-interacting GTPase 1
MVVLAGGGTANAGREGMLSVDRIEVQIVRSDLPQVFARVHGVLTDGCTSLGAISQRRNAQVITVTISTRHSDAEMCTMLARLVDETIRLEGTFAPGSYTVDVNGVVQKFRV